MDKIESAVKWMEDHAKNPKHGYDQQYRWGEKGDYDCSSAVISAWEAAGVPVKLNGATYTGNILPVFLKCGFKDVSSEVNKGTGAGLKRGDVLLNIQHHVAMYCGNGKEVEASINEKGKAVGGVPGDQTGREFLVRSYRNYPWDKVLRYVGAEAKKPKAKPQNESKTALSVDGSWGPATTKALQKHYGTTTDGIISDQYAGNKKYLSACSITSWIFVWKTYHGSDVIKAMQKDLGVTVDGICGQETIKALQKKVGAYVDGYMGVKTVKAVQTWLNK